MKKIYKQKLKIQNLKMRQMELAKIKHTINHKFKFQILI